MPTTHRLLHFLNAAVLSRDGRERHHWLCVRYRAIALLSSTHDPEGLSRRMLAILSPSAQQRAA